MKISQEKQKKLAYVARRYYLENQRQSDIARELGVSRPMVSRMLAEARELGVVEITVHDAETRTATLLERLRLSTSVRGGVLVEDGADEDATNQLLSQGAVELLRQLDTRRLGVGWGYLIGQLVTWLEKHPQPDSPVTDICPLVGNANIPARNYQSNENVRLMAQQLGAAPHFLYLPALPEGAGGKAAAVLHRGLPPDPPAVGAAGHGPGEHRELPLQPGLRLSGAVRQPAPAVPRLRPDAGLLFQ